MPIIKSAKKKLRQDIKRTKQNKRYELTYKKAIDAVKKRQKGQKTDKLLREAYQAIDKAAKKKIIHKNKASRLKAKVARLLNK